MILTNYSTVQAPAIQLSPGGSRSVYYSGEDLNVTCISTVVGAVFTWRAVNVTAQQPLIIPNTTVSSGSNASVLVFRPFKVRYHVLVELTCAIAFSKNVNITENLSSTSIRIQGELFSAQLKTSLSVSSSIVEYVSVFQC